MTMRSIVGIIIKYQVSSGKWLISEAILDNVRVYIYWYGDDVDDILKVELDQMVEEKDDLEEARHLRRNLEQTHMKMQEDIKIKPDKYLEPLLEVPS